MDRLNRIANHILPEPQNEMGMEPTSASQKNPDDIVIV
jgi:hypothetical protein